MVTGHFWVNPSVARPTQSGARHPSAEASPFGWPGSADVNLYGQVLNCLSDRWSPFQECWFHAGHGRPARDSRVGSCKAGLRSAPGSQAHPSDVTSKDAVCRWESRGRLGSVLPARASEQGCGWARRLVGSSPARPTCARLTRARPRLLFTDGGGSSKPMASMSRVSGPFSRSRAGWPVETHLGHGSVLTDRWKTRSPEARATLTVARSREAPSEGGGAEQPGGEDQGEETARGLSAPLFVSPSEPRPAHSS